MSSERAQHLRMERCAIEGEQEVFLPPVPRHRHQHRMGNCISHIWRRQRSKKAHTKVVDTILAIVAVAGQQIPLATDSLQDAALGLVSTPIGAHSVQLSDPAAERATSQGRVEIEPLLEVGIPCLHERDVPASGDSRHCRIPCVEP